MVLDSRGTTLKHRLTSGAAAKHVIGQGTLENRTTVTHRVLSSGSVIKPVSRLQLNLNITLQYCTICIIPVSLVYFVLLAALVKTTRVHAHWLHTSLLETYVT